VKAELILKVILPPLIIFAVLVALTIAKVISGWTMYILWILGFVVANLIVTRITAKWSYQQRKAKRLQEEKGKQHNE
jgi:F0F1-type ATP synthase assembly protein I